MQQNFTNDTEAQAARSNAERWIARFAPLIETPIEPTTEGLRKIQTLQREGEARLSELSPYGTEDDQMLLATLRDALSHLKLTEETLRPKLAERAGSVNLVDLRAKIAEASARQELGALTPENLELELSQGSLGAAAGMLLFSFVWLSFTSVHATFMIGGMWKAFGPVALFLLAFYSLFFGAGFLMLKGALEIASKEGVSLHGNTLVISKKLGPWVRTKQIVLGPQSRASLEIPNLRQNGSRAMAITVNDSAGKSHQFGVGAIEHLKKDVVKKLNRYLANLSASSF
jgi:hypothetical protein